MRNKEKVFEEFKSKAKIVHGNAYDYTDSVYECSRTALEIYCNTCEGTFPQRPAAHLQGQGCPSCGEESRKNTRKDNLIDFMGRCHEKFGDRFLYSSCVFTSINVKVTITCRHHGDFTVLPRNFLSIGCTSCNGITNLRKRQRDFLKKVAATPELKGVVFLEKDYINNSTKITGTCTIHNEKVSKTPNKLLESKSSGCKHCRKASWGRWGVRSAKRIPNVEKHVGHLYVGKVKGISAYKIGITKHLRKRMDIFKRDLRPLGTSFNYVTSIQTDLLTATVMETVLHKVYNGSLSKHNLDFGGKDEMFDIEDFTLISDIISGRFDIEFANLANTVVGNTDPQLLSFVDKIKRDYNI